MAQFLTLLSILLLVAAFNPIVCPTNHMFSERRDRARYIESSEQGAQYLGDSNGSVGSRFRKTPSHKDHNASYRSQAAIPPLSLTQNAATTTTEQTTTDSIVDQNIRIIFSTNFKPGLHIFNNTEPFVNQPHINSYADQMVGDQPDPYIPPPSAPSSDKVLFKVQRSPNGNLTIIYNKDYIRKDEKDISSAMVTDHLRQSSGSNNESFENRFQTHFPGGLPLKKGTIDSLPTEEHTRTKDSALHFPTEEPEEPEKENFNYKIDVNDCKDGAAKGKSLCTNLRNYPSKTHLENLIKEKFPNLEAFFGEDLVLPQNISQRMNVPNEESLCRTRIRTIYPEAGENKDYNWFVIVNTRSYKQGIRIEECIENESTCGESNGLSLPNRYVATCKQNFIYRSLVAYTSNETIIKENFRVPSCCKCVLRSVLN